MSHNVSDMRWKQRFDNFSRAYAGLQEAITLSKARTLTKLEEQGLIQSFEYTHELAWKLLKDYLQEQGFNEVIGSKSATRLAFKEGLIRHGDIWMEMIESRNQTSHSYNMDIAAAISEKIITVYGVAFGELFVLFESLRDKKS